ncbi:MAG TPA: 50S ribosomal protein L6 [Candidatus Kaiserbacteria bacterium]|nr:50S ribosomal protein L6 [Candidatus Kaiserbacteria bacterium]
MSRIGKQKINIPEKTEVSVSDNVISVKGPLGELTRALHPTISVSVDGNEVTVTPNDKSPLAQALWGTYASHIGNMIDGVNKAFEKKLIIEGIGYRANLSGKNLELVVGFSHPVIFTVPEGLTVNVEKNNISVSGSDKEKVGQFTAEIRAVKKPEPYKGKGIRYENEVVLRKQGKKTA